MVAVCPLSVQLHFPSYHLEKIGTENACVALNEAIRNRPKVRKFRDMKLTFQSISNEPITVTGKGFICCMALGKRGDVRVYLFLRSRRTSTILGIMWRYWKIRGVQP